MAERDAVRLHWRGANDENPLVTIDVVTIEALPAFAKQRAADVAVLLGVMGTSLAELKDWVEAGADPAALRVTRGSRGVLGAPKLVRRLAQSTVGGADGIAPEAASNEES